MSAGPDLAIGIGCRLNCPAQAIAALVAVALARVPGGEMAQKTLFTLEHKRGQACIAEAARLLEMELRYLSVGSLQAAMPRVQTFSSRAQALLGVASVAEAAALAGAGLRAQLIVARLAADGATCAIAADMSQQGGQS